MMKMEATDRRFDRRRPSEGRPSIGLQRKLVETKHAANQTPDLTDFMNDIFFGTMNDGDEKKGYNIIGGRDVRDRCNDDFDSSTRSVSSRQTQEWLEEAKRMVASSPSREGESPSRLVSSPRFASAQGRLSTSSIDRRDPFSRSARRHRAVQGISVEILSRTAASHTRNGSESNLDPPQSDSEPSSPGSEIQKWISNNLKHTDPTISPDPTPPSPTSNLGAPPLPPRQSFHRRTRFQTDPRSPLSHPITTTPSPSNPPANSIPKRNFKNTPSNTNAISGNQLLSPPKILVESAHRRSVSSSTCSVPDPGLLSPPRNLVESAHRRSVSSSTCRNDRIFQKENMVHLDDGQRKNGDLKDQEKSNNFSKDQDFNSFLKEQRVKIEMLMNGEINGRAKIVLSGPSNSTSSMVAATCYAWLLENKNRANKKEGARNDNFVEFVVPVMNIRREKMWKQRQAAWLFHHAGLDAASLLFSNEVDLETLMMEKQLSMLVVGEDILKTNGEVGSGCTVLTDNYCEDAYDLLQTPMLKKLLMAGILLDTQNLSPSPKLSMTRDAEAVQLLSVASALNYRNSLFDQLMQDHKEAGFYEVMCRTYGKPTSEINWENSEKISSDKVIAQNDDKKQDGTNETRIKKNSPISGKPTPSPLQNPNKEAVKANEANRGKNRNFFAKLFGFGSK